VTRLSSLSPNTSKCSMPSSEERRADGPTKRPRRGRPPRAAALSFSSQIERDRPVELDLARLSWFHGNDGLRVDVLCRARLEDGGIAQADCRGDGAIYTLGYDERGWWCSCAAMGRCAHLHALGLVTVLEPREGAA
jgi:hypothetical protein